MEKETPKYEQGMIAGKLYNKIPSEGCDGCDFNTKDNSICEITNGSFADCANKYGESIFQKVTPLPAAKWESKYLLMTRDNPDGWKLEDLLEQIIKELRLKSKDTIARTIDLEVTYRIVTNNMAIEKKLIEAKNTQINSMDFLADKFGKDKGPKEPRI